MIVDRPGQPDLVVLFSMIVDRPGQPDLVVCSP